MNKSIYSDKSHQELIYGIIENLRKKLLDFTRRNPLVSTAFSYRTYSYIRAIDELPEILFYKLSQGEKLLLRPLPFLEDEPLDEKSEKFQNELAEAKLIDEKYLDVLEKIDPSDEEAGNKEYKAERELRDRLREQLDMPRRQTKSDLSLTQHAKNNGISPSFELPEENEEQQKESHYDNDIQTLLLPDKLERVASKIDSKNRSWQQETGINVLYAAFGFLEWVDPIKEVKCLSPIITIPINMIYKKTSHGSEYWVEGSGDKDAAEINHVLFELLQKDYSINLPKYEQGSIEEYFSHLTDLKDTPIKAKVRRFVAFGVFPSMRLPMYYDLNTKATGFRTNEIVDQLLGGKQIKSGVLPYAEDYEVDKPEIEKKIPFLVLDADSSQFSTLVDVVNGKNLSVEGPPGTGKSQTIVNAIAAAIAKGKKVLFVAEKTAALNVVRNRLEERKLGEFLLPLTAEKSAKKEVIASLKRRILLDNEGLREPDEYNYKMITFHNIREEINKYINIVKEPFRNTGYNIYEILGRALLLNHFIDDLPDPVQIINNAELRNLKKERIGELKSLVKILEVSYGKVMELPNYWRGLSCFVNQFDMKNLLTKASIVSDNFLQTSNNLEKIREFGIDENDDLKSIDVLSMGLDLINRSKSDIDFRILRNLLQNDNTKCLHELLSKSEAARKKRDELTRIIKAPIVKDIANKLRELRQICSDCNLVTLELGILESTIKKSESLYNAKCEQLNSLKTFLANNQEISGYHVSVFSKVREIVDEYSSDVLIARSPVTENPNMIPILEMAINTGVNLYNEKIKLSEQFQIDYLQSSKELNNIRETIQNSGIFGFLSKKYRIAKHNYRTIFKEKRYVKKIAIDQINLLYHWKKEVETFETDERVKKVFGDYYNSINTNFELFSKLVNFYWNVDEKLQGYNQREIRKFLKNAEIDIIQSIPEIHLLDEWRNCAVNEQILKRKRSQLEKMKRGFIEIEDLVDIIVDFKVIRPANLLTFADKVEEYIENETSVNNNPIRELLGDLFKGIETNVNEFQDYIKIINIIKKYDKWRVLIISLLDEKDKDIINKVHQTAFTYSDATRKAKASLRDLSTESGIPIEYLSSSKKLSEIHNHLREMSNDEDGLIANSEYYRILHSLKDGKFDKVALKIIEISGNANNLSDKIEALIFRNYSKEIHEQYNEFIMKYTGETMNDLRERFSTIDKKLKELSCECLRSNLIKNANPPTGVGSGRRTEWTDGSLINLIIYQKQPRPSVRDLLRRSKNALLEIKPCWMMSPLAVAQYMDQGNAEFDLCIIDEASQMTPENAIGALLHSKQTMIVGDTNQLPPTTFFQRFISTGGENGDEDIFEESILEMANQTFYPLRRLKWHYRSKHSGLIQFSNRMVYNDELIVFPSANENELEMGVEYRFIDGLYKSNTNAIEAEKIVDAIIKFMENDQKRSLGVVTFNIQQTTLIQEKFEYVKSNNRTVQKYIEYWENERDGLSRFFIKNLENVQGDERDVIFIGTLFGPAEPGGRVFQRFGPITQTAGKRRLNVLFTRAKEKIVTFSSMNSNDILADENRNPGAYMLKKWLEYSASGVLESGMVSEKGTDSPLEEFVGNQIKSMGCEIDYQVGVAGCFIDIGVKHPKWPHGYLLGVECDGASYHSSKSARDRDRLRQEILERLGWHFHRVWSTNWFNNPRGEAEKLRERIQERLDDVLSRKTVERVKPERRKEKLVFKQDEEQIDIISTLPLFEEKKVDFEEEIIISQPKEIELVAQIGDTVSIQYLDKNREKLTYFLSKEKDDLANGYLHIDKPLAYLLLDTEEGDEIQILTKGIKGPKIRRAIVERIVKASN